MCFTFHIFCKNLMISAYNFAKRFFSTHQRKSFKVLDQNDINFFKSILPAHGVILDQAELQQYNLCWRNVNNGNSKIALRPKNTQTVSKILSYCNKNHLAVVPQSGNTGLVGGSVPVFDEVILSMKDMNKIQDFDQISSVLSCEAGCILEKLNDYLEPQKFQIPLDLGAKGSCLIGGNAATNAGGKYVIKHGSFRSHILGLEAVLPNGQILNMRSRIHKDNTGYDIKDLFIGSQGTLGIITKLDISCAKIDQQRNILVFKSDSYQKIISSIPILKQKLGRSLNALQYMDGITYQAVIRNLYPSIMNVAENEHLLFVQISKSADEIMNNVLDGLPQFNEAIMSTNDKQFKNIWKIREDVSVAAKAQGKVHSYDVSFDVKYWPEILKMLRQKIDCLILGYGHIGDGNIHINICYKDDREIDDTELFNFVVSKNGSISAEHGVGLHKPQFLHLQKSQSILNVYQQIKKIFDPNGIMNPYKYLP